MLRKEEEKIVTEQRERLERALRGCAGAGIPDAVDLWPAIEERVSPAPGRPRLLWFVPRTRTAWILIALLMTLFATGAYGASKWVYDLFRSELPGAGAENPGTDVYERKVTDGAAVTVEWAYADTEFMVVGYSVEDLKEDRRNAGRPATLEPLLIGEESGRDKLPPHVDVTDEDGRDFDLIDGTTYTLGIGDIWNGALPNTAVFAVPEGLEPENAHLFRFQVPLEERPIPSSREEAEKGFRMEQKPPIGPFAFEFEIPVRSAPTVEMDQTVKANGVEITLDRVVNSPARPQAVICFDPPNDAYDWSPTVAAKPAWREPIETLPLGNGCWSAPLYGLPKDRSSLTVTDLWGTSRSDTPGNAVETKTIRGPWKFDFEIPEK